MKSAMLEMRQLSFAYPAGRQVFADFSWSVDIGESWAIIGPSGCGKSTLLYLLAGILAPVQGEIVIAGQRLSRPRPRTGLILQDYGLLPWATVRDNVALGLKIRQFYGLDGKHTPRDENLERIAGRTEFWLERLGIKAVAERYPGQISGGQRQRAAIARTLALNPDLLLMDEPFGALDALTREDLQELVLELQREQKLTTVLVTHLIEEAVLIGQKILVLGQPPISQAQIVSNPGAGEPGFRAAPEFAPQANRLRELLSNHMLARGDH